jgi:hypothetical protein
MKRDDDDWKRSLVCGLYWPATEASIAVNIRQLRFLISKCKSSINGSFQRLGFSIVPAGADGSAAILTYLPILKDSLADLRQWTIRRLRIEGGATKTAIQQTETTKPKWDDFPIQEEEQRSGFNDPLSFAPGENGMKDWEDDTNWMNNTGFGE